MTEGARSPDCKAGKHAACSGDAWDTAKDEPIDCACPCHREVGAGPMSELGDG